MLSLNPSAETQVRAFLAQQQELPFSYPEVGATRQAAPHGYATNAIRVRLGSGGAIYARAVAAMRRWTMFDMPWIRLYWRSTPIEPGQLVVLLARTYGVWSLNACRIIYVIDEQESLCRFGFGYGTLPGHVERGEERFTVEWNRDDDSVWYEIFAFARPAHPLVRLAAPLGRRAQRRFARESAAAMRFAVTTGGC